jgi:hypothetical protein
MREIGTKAGTDFFIIRLCRTFINIAEHGQCSMLLYKISYGRQKLYTDYISIALPANMIVLEECYRITVLLNQTSRT